MIECALLRGRDRYERVVDGWIDNTHEDAFTHTVRLMDDDLGVELSAVATGSPSYEIREARSRVQPAAGALSDWALLGALEGGETLFVVYTRRRGRIRIVTARPATDREKRRYRKGGK